jgi:hypothetical protein
LTQQEQAWTPAQTGRQRGLFTREQAMAGGLSRGQVQRRIASGLWRPVAGQALTLASDAPRGHWQIHAVALTWPDAIVYGISAIQVWEQEAPVGNTAVIHCASPHQLRPQTGLIPHVVAVPDSDIAIREGVRVQKLTPAVAAALAAMDKKAADSLLAWMVARRRINAEEFAVAVEAHRGRRGYQRLLAYIPRVAGRSASEAEALARSIYLRYGITGWEANVLVKTARGAALSADFLFKELRIIVFIDGRAYHGDRHAFQADRSDQNELIASGYLVLRFTWADITERPDQVAGLTIAAIEQRQRQFHRQAARH